MPNKYDTVADELFGAQSSQLDASLIAAKGTNPDDYAKSVKLGRETGIPYNVVQLNRPAIEGQAQTERAKKAIKYDSIAAQWLSNPDNAKLAHDDVENLSAFESTISGLKMAGRYITGSDPRGSLGRDIRAGYFQASAGAAGALRAATDILATPFDILEQLPSIGGNPLRRLEEGFGLIGQSSAADAARVASKFDSTAGAGFSSGIQSLTSNLINLPLAFMPGGQGAYLGAASSQAGGQSYQRAREAGIDARAALLYGASDASIEFVTEKIPLGKLLGGIAESSGFVKTLLKTAAAEIPGEQIATVFQDMNEWAVLNPEKPFSEYLAERPSAAAQTLIATVVGTGGVVATAHGISLLTGQEKTQKAGSDSRIIESINQLAQASKVAQRDTETFESFIAQATEDGPVSDLYIDAETFKQSGIADQVIEALPSVAGQYQEALATGGTIRIPLSEYVARIATKPELSGPLLEHLKTDPIGFSASEAQTYQKEQGPALEAEIGRALEQAQGSDAFNASREAVKQSVLDNLNAVARNTPAVNETYATLVAARTAVRAKQLGITPEEMFAKQQLRVQGEQVGGEVVNQGKSLADIRTQWESSGIDAAVFESNGVVTLSKIVVPKSERQLGKGTAAMQSLIDYADATGQRIALTPSADFGGNKKRLAEFYKRFGFVENKGKRKDFTTRETMIREPQTLKQSALSDTIDIDGVQRSTVNSNGQPIAQTEEGVRNFWRWFGESKVVDGQGRPQVVYHGTDTKFTKINMRKGAQGLFWFTSDKSKIEAGEIGAAGKGVIMELYAKVENPADWKQYNRLGLYEYGREGIDGAILKDADGSFDGFVLDNKQIKSVANKGQFDPANANILKQLDRGNYSPSQNIISLLKNADLSTVLHEVGHYFYENDIALANELLAKPERTAGEQQIVDDVSALLKWHGFEGDANEQIDQWNQLTFEEKRQHHERTAESFEAYLYSGKAPSIELSTYFQKFREYLLQVYKSLKQFLAGHPEAGKLNDEVRGVFDRMLATDEQIQLAEQARSMLPLFKTAEEASKFGVDFEAYQALAKGSTQAAVEALQARGLKDMQWLHNARGREVSKLKKQSEALRREIRQQVRTEVMQRPVYRAWSFLTRRITDYDKLTKAKKKEGVDPTQDSLFTAIAKLGGLNKDEVIATWGVDSKSNAMPEFGKHVLKKEGRSIDAMLEVLAENGYLSVDENGKADTRELEEKFDNELRGKPEYSFQKDYNEPNQVANPDALGAGRLDAALIQNMNLKPEVVKRLEDFKMTRKTGGLHPDLVADMFGFGSGDDLAVTLYEADPPQTAIEKATDARMLAEHGDLATPEAIEKAADRALYNAARGKMLVADANALAKATAVQQDAGADKKGRKRTINILPAAAKEAAANLIARVQIRNLRPTQYEAAEIKAGKATEKAKNAGKLEEAAGQARTRLFNHYAAMAAYEAVDEVDAGRKYLKKIQEPGKIPADYFDQIQSLLAKFDLRQVTDKALDNTAMFQTWARAQLEAGNVPPSIELLLSAQQRTQYAREVNQTNEDGSPVYADEESQAVLLASMLDQSPVRNYRTLTIEEFRSLVEAVKQIEHMGKRTRKVLTDRKKREFAAVVKNISENIIAVATKKGRVSSDVKTPTPGTLASKHLSWRGFWGSHIKAATNVQIMDGGYGGPMWESLIQSANEAGNGEVLDSAEAYKAVQALLRPVKELGKITDRPKKFPSIGESLNRQERIVMAMNLGNESNEQRLLGGKSWTRAQIQPVLDTLTEADWKFVQGMWDLYETYRPRIAALEREINGVEPEWIEARPLTVTTADGKTLKLRGGYAPVIFDPRASGKAASFAAEKDAKAMMQAARVASTVNKSFTKQRVNEVKGRPLLLSLDAMIGGIQDTIHYLHWQPWIIDANRLVKALDEPIRTHYGAETVSQLRAWVGDNAAGTRPARDGAERVITNLARNVSFAGLAFNFFSAVQQITGYSQSVAVVGAKWMGKGVAKTLENPRKAYIEATGKSAFMRKRGITRMRDLAETHTVVRDQGPIRTALDEAGYAMMLAMQSAVDVPTWWAAYEKALDAGHDEVDAVSRADQAVIDSQGSGMAKDLAMVERASGAMRLLTGFMSFMNTTLNANYRALKSDESAGKKAADLVLINIIPVALTMLLKSILFPSGDDDEEKEPTEIAKEYAAEQVSFVLGQMIGFREVSQIGSAVLGLPSYGYQGAVGMRMFADSLKLAQQVGQGDSDLPLLKTAVSTASDFLRLPGTQINRTITGTEALISDETDNPAAIAFGYRK